jgi:hypothetical protein
MARFSGNDASIGIRIKISGINLDKISGCYVEEKIFKLIVFCALN